MSRLKWFQSLLNYRTALIVGISMISCYTAISYDVRIKPNMVLFGLIISFPIVYSLQSAFKNRQTALKYISGLAATVITVREIFDQCEKLPDGKRLEVQEMLSKCYHDFLYALRTGREDPVEALKAFAAVHRFMVENSDKMSSKFMITVDREMREVYNCGFNMIGAKYHKSVRVVRAMSFFFSLIFPVIQAAFLLDIFGGLVPHALIYFIAFGTTLTISAILLLQKQLDDPFDQDGLDDIKLELYALPKLIQR